MASLIVTFRFGAEEDEMMGLSLAKEITLDQVEVYPNPIPPFVTTKEQVYIYDTANAEQNPRHLLLA